MVRASWLCQLTSRIQNTCPNHRRFTCRFNLSFIEEEKTAFLAYIYIWVISRFYCTVMYTQCYISLVYSETYFFKRCRIQFWIWSQAQFMQNWNNSNWHAVKGLGKLLSQAIHLFKADTDAGAAQQVKQSQKPYGPRNLPLKRNGIRLALKTMHSIQEIYCSIRSLLHT